MRKITEIILHCAATPEGKDFTVADIDRWHRARKFNGIGYHYVIYRDGTVHAGRPVERSGAHCTGHNAQSVGVCYIGGCATDAQGHAHAGTAGRPDLTGQKAARAVPRRDSART